MKNKKQLNNHQVQGQQFCLTPLNQPLPTSPYAGFPHLIKVMEREWGKILAPHHGAGQGWVQTFQTHPAPPHPMLLRVIIVNFSYLKTLLFKQTYQYQLILFYPMQFSVFILLCFSVYVCVCDYIVKHLDILFKFFSKN